MGKARLVLSKTLQHSSQKGWIPTDFYRTNFASIRYACPLGFGSATMLTDILSHHKWCLPAQQQLTEKW